MLVLQRCRVGERPRRLLQRSLGRLRPQRPASTHLATEATASENAKCPGEIAPRRASTPPPLYSTYTAAHRSESERAKTAATRASIFGASKIEDRPEAAITTVRRGSGSDLRAIRAWCMAAAVALGACASAPKKTSVGRALDADLNARDVRGAIHEYAAYFASEVEAAANRVARAADNEATMRNAIDWKSNATAAVYAAAFHDDPYLAAVDVRVLIAQMRQFLQSQKGAKAFASYQPSLLASMTNLEHAYDEVARKLRKSRGFEGAGKLRPKIMAWAQKHPLTDLEFQREPVAFKFIDTLGQDRYTGLAAVERMQTQLADVLDRTRLYAAYLPKQGRWQARIFLDETMSDPRVAGLFELTDGLDETLDLTTDFMTGIPGFIATERAVVLSHVEKITDEVLERVGQERALVLETLQGERKLLVDLVRSERQAIAAEAKIAARELIDHTFWRIIQLALVFSVLGGAAFLAYRWFTYGHPFARPAQRLALENTSAFLAASAPVSGQSGTWRRPDDVEASSGGTEPSSKASQKGLAS